MTCEDIRELLSDLLDDELADGARARVEAHLGSCQPCSTRYRALKRTVRFVRANALTRLQAETPGGAYMDFTRALTDESDQTPEQAIATWLSGGRDVIPHSEQREESSPS